MHVTRITTNLKKIDGKHKTYPIGKHTIIVGPNGSGKSAIVQSITLALLGYASGLLGRRGPVRLPAHLLRAAGPDGIAILAEMSDGSNVEYRLAPGKRAERKVPDGVTAALRGALDVETVREAFSGSPDAAVRLLADHVGGVPPVVAQSVLSALTGEAHTHLSDVLAGMTYHPTTVAQWSALYGVIGEGVKEAKGIVSQADIIGGFFREGPPAQQTPGDPPSGPSRDMMVASALAMEEWAKGNAVAQAVSKLPPNRQTEKIGNSWKDTAVEHWKRDMDAAIQHGQKTAALNTVAAIVEMMDKRKAEGERKIRIFGEIQTAIMDAIRASVQGKGVDNFLIACRALRPNFIFDRNLMIPGSDGGIGNGKERWGLSGSEEAAALVAMTAALSNPGKLNIVALDDRDFDPVHLSDTIRALDAAPAQILITTTRLPAGRFRGGWDILDLTE